MSVAMKKVVQGGYRERSTTTSSSLWTSLPWKREILLPAEHMLVDTAQLFVMKALLTGESVPLAKQTELIEIRKRKRGRPNIALILLTLVF